MTDDLPTPPLPDAIASTRVRESVNGLGRCSWPPVPASVVRVPAAVQPGRERGALLVGHDGEVDVDVRDAGERGDRIGDPLGDLAAQRAPGDRRARP